MEFELTHSEIYLSDVKVVVKDIMRSSTVPAPAPSLELYLIDSSFPVVPEVIVISDDDTRLVPEVIVIPDDEPGPASAIVSVAEWVKLNRR